MIEIANIIVPVFGIIALGYGVGRMPLFEGDLHQRLSDFVMWVPIPALLFRVMAQADFSGAAPFSIWGVYFSALAVIWLTAQTVTRLLFKIEGSRSIIAGVSASFSNMVLVGMPVILSAYGEDGLAPLLVILSIHLPVMMTVSTLLIERANVSDGNLQYGAVSKKLLINLSRNPIVLSLIAGALWRFSGFDIPVPLDNMIGQLAGAAAPLALFALGLSLYHYGLGEHIGPSATLMLLKIIVFPTIVFFSATHIAHLPPVWVAGVTLAAACPSGVNAYVMANHFKTGIQLAAQTITLATFFSMFSLAFWIWVLERFGANL